MRRALAVIASLTWMLAAGTPPADAASRYDSSLRFRSLRTPHFTIHYHQGEERHARRLAGLAEGIRTDLERQFGLPAPPHTHVILVDQTDAANGWSTPIPYNVIELTLAPPAPASYLGYHDDWLRLVFTHEYAHTMHLDQVGGWMRPFRWLLGRHPLSFPNLFVPTWQVEGLATYAESLAGRGRLRAPHVRAMTGALARDGLTPRLDQLSGGYAGWPAGLAPYVMGGQLLDAEATRTGGPASVGALARGTARRVPFFGGRAYTRVFGRSADQAWRDLNSPGATPGSGVTEATGRPHRLTWRGYATTTPRFGPGDGQEDVWYSSATAHAFPSLRRLSADGSGDRQVATRIQGGGLGFWREWAIFDQYEYDRAVAIYSDLWAVRRGDGASVRLTRARRLADPDVSPDGAALAAVIAADGQRDLVVLALSATEAGTPRVDERPRAQARIPGCAFASPRWSPDGRYLAAVMHCRDALSAIVVLDAALEHGTRVAPAPDAHDVTPAWTPDGRWVLFASDRGAPHHRILAAPLDALSDGTVVRVVVDVPGGATAPDVSPSGTTIVFLSETGTGSEVFSLALPALPVRAERAPRLQPVASLDTRPPHPDAAEPLPGDAPYVPWRTMLPRAWQPLVSGADDRAQYGGTVSGSDVLGRHVYGVTALWSTRVQERTDGWPGATRFDWYGSYTYDRWRPTVLLAASAESGTVGLRVGARSVQASTRTHEAFAGVFQSIRRVRWNQALLVGLSLDRQRILLPGDAHMDRDRHSFRAGWAFSSARQYGYSISREDGLVAGVTIDQTWPALGADGRATTTSGDVRVYVPTGLEHTVLALRAAAVSSTGAANVVRLSGNGAVGAPSSPLSFDSRRAGFVRGFGTDTITGRTTGGLNADLRFPIRRIDRGFRTWPLFVNHIHGGLFVDGAAAGDSFRGLNRHLWSAGGELAATVTVGYGMRMTVAAGAAWTHDRRREDRPWRAAAFVRTGYAF